MGVDDAGDLAGEGDGEPSGPARKKKKVPVFGPSWDAKIKYIECGVEKDGVVTITKEFAWKTYQEQKSMVPCALYGIKGNFKWSVLLSSMVNQLHPDMEIAKAPNKTVAATLSKCMKSWYPHEVFATREALSSELDGSGRDTAALELSRPAVPRPQPPPAPGLDVLALVSAVPPPPFVGPTGVPPLPPVLGGPPAPRKTGRKGFVRLTVDDNTVPEDSVWIHRRVYKKEVR